MGGAGASSEAYAAHPPAPGGESELDATVVGHPGGGRCTGGLCARWEAARARLLVTVVLHPWFDRVVLAAVVANSVCLTLDNPLNDQNTSQAKALGALDKVRGWHRWGRGGLRVGARASFMPRW
jgi:hypothetical protein